MKQLVAPFVKLCLVQPKVADSISMVMEGLEVVLDMGVFTFSILKRDFGGWLEGGWLGGGVGGWVGG